MANKTLYSVRYTINGARLRIRVEADNPRNAQKIARESLPEHANVIIGNAYPL